MRSHCMRQRRCYNHALIGCNRSRDACGRARAARPSGSTIWQCPLAAGSGTWPR